ncbi:transglycosylase domain-containing protein [Streptomyces sp. NPDC048172]|uniref:transglycosylase domain-containing protein n=1 Tax=Streptomyces sp. NPDC048172 TaxID=3365505 RepID=UPI00372275E0
MSDEPKSEAEGWEPRPEGPSEESGKKRRRTGWRRVIPTWRMVLGGVLLILLLVSGAMVAGYLLVSIPEPNKAAAAQTNVYLYSDGSQIARDGKVNRENISLAQVPKRAQHAVLAAEDRDFYHESAIDPKAMLRAGWKTLTGGDRQGGSTITQQYVKNYYLNQEQTVTRKAKEFFISLKLDREVSKDDVLQGYLNTSYFGRNAYGIQSAAHAYYGKDVGDLSTAEGAYLAALVNSPNAYDTRAHPENRKRAVARWNYVLDGMVKEGWLEESKREKLKFPEPDRAKPPNSMSGQRGYLVEAVKNYLISNKIIDEQRLAAGGFRITTTLQPKKQKAMRDAVDKQLMKRLDKKGRKVDKFVRAGGSSVDPKSGKVVAMYGGIGYTKQYVNNATRRDYQVGSTFKPFIFTSAVQNKSKTQDGVPINARTVYDGTNKRKVMSDGRATDYAPENEDHRSYGQIPVSTAMDKSVNSVFAQMGVDVGPRKVKNTAIDLGVPPKTPNMPEDGSIALGVTTASTLDMAEAYATLANHGKHGHYRLVEKMTRGGEVTDLPEQDTKQAVPRVAADSTTAILRNVVKGGTGTAAQSAGRPAAGKTGTAEEDKAAWFAGYTPELSTVIAVMGQDSKSGVQKPLYGAAGLARVNGGGFPAEIWGAYTKSALDGTPVRDFKLNTDGQSADLPSTQPPTTQAPTTKPPETDDPTTPPPSSEEPPETPTKPEPPSTKPPETPTIPPEIGGVDGGDVIGGDDGGVVGGDTGGDPGGAAANGDPNGGAWDGGNTADGAPGGGW